MAYDGPRTKYTAPFASGAATVCGIRGPKGKAGLLYDYGVQGVTVALAGSTSTPKVQVGTTATPAAYGTAFDPGALAINKGKSVRSTYTPDQAAFDALLVNRVIPADTDIELSMVAGVGTPAGTGTMFCDIIWAT
jgi:hypothetical protein